MIGQAVDDKAVQSQLSHPKIECDVTGQRFSRGSSKNRLATSVKHSAVKLGSPVVV